MLQRIPSIPNHDPKMLARLKTGGFLMFSGRIEGNIGVFVYFLCIFCVFVNKVSI